MKLIRRRGAKDGVVYVGLCDGVYVRIGEDRIGLRTTKPGLVSAIFLVVLYYGWCFATNTPPPPIVGGDESAADINEPEIEAFAAELDEPDAVDGEGIATSKIFRFIPAFFCVLAMVCMLGCI